jgi:hypothetical protein
VEQRLAAEGQARRRHPVQLDPRLGGVQRPRVVLNMCRDEASIPLREEPVALDEKVLERARPGALRGPGGRIGRREADTVAGTEVVNPLAVRRRHHPGEAVAKTVERSPDRDEERARGVEAEEPDGGHAADAHVGPHVQLRDRSQHEPARADLGPRPGHYKGDDCQPGGSVADVRLDGSRQQAANLVRLGRPVREQQVLPAL